MTKKQETELEVVMKAARKLLKAFPEMTVNQVLTIIIAAREDN